MLILLKISKSKSLILRDYLINRFTKDIAKGGEGIEVLGEF